MSAWAAAVCRAPYGAVGLAFPILFLQKICWFKRKRSHSLRSSIIVSLAASAPATTFFFYVLSSLLVVLNLIRSDDLLHPDYGQTAIRARRPILFLSSMLYNVKAAWLASLR